MSTNGQTPYAIESEALGRSFRGHDAVRELTFRVPAGNVYGLLGPNGAGKTTATRMLVGALRPTAGRARVLGKDCARLRGSELRCIGYVAEDQQLPGWMRLDQLIAYLRPLYPDWDPALCDELRGLLRLRLESRIRKLSRGMKMKAGLLVALVYRPRLIILDEPFAGLDPQAREELVEGLVELLSESGSTVLVCSHDLDTVEKLVDAVGFLEEGRLLLSETIDGLRRRFRDVEVFGEELRLPDATPPSWIRPRQAASSVRFTHSEYREGESEKEIRALLQGTQRIEASPLSLRETFIAVQRMRRREEAS